MREIETRRRRRKRRGCGCGFGIFNFILFLAVICTAAYFVGRVWFGSDWTSKIKTTQYPLKYQHFVEKYADEYDLDKYLVYAVIRTESRFDRYAVSSANAKGLMQITDETGADCANRIGLTDFTSDALFDPETNIRLGCYYLNHLIKTYKSDIIVALAAYNGGIGNVNSWLNDPNYSDKNGKLVSIPFGETRNYVSRVTEAHEMYKSIYESNN